MKATALATVDRVLDTAQRLVQTRGFNGFSYADIADELKIRKASIHHHFPTKEGLGRALVQRYHRAFFDALGAIERDSGDEKRQLRQYADLYIHVVRDNEQMCLCGMLAADLKTLPRAIRGDLEQFFEQNEAWLSKVLTSGRRARVLDFAGPPAAKARLILSSLEGAMLVARSHGGVGWLESVAESVLAGLRIERNAPPRRASRAPEGQAPR